MKPYSSILAHEQKGSFGVFLYRGEGRSGQTWCINSERTDARGKIKLKKVLLDARDYGTIP